VTDPVFCPKGAVHDYRLFKSRRIAEPHHDPIDLTTVDLWLFTHGHLDHCDLSGFDPALINQEILCDRSAARQLRRYGRSREKTTILKWGQTRSYPPIKGISLSIEAIPAIHGLNRFKGLLIGNGNGYWIEIAEGNVRYTIYISGDTLPLPIVTRHLDNRRCDLFIANTGAAHIGKGILSNLIGRVTMQINDIAIFKKHFTPSTTIPIHWDAFQHYQERDLSSLTDQPSNLTIINPGQQFQCIR
jgi:N-acyl-phosphatidylethanolamine-hydrolysing phospholipase D